MRSISSPHSSCRAARRVLRVQQGNPHCHEHLDDWDQHRDQHARFGGRHPERRGSQGQVGTQGSSTGDPSSASGSTTSGSPGATASGTSTDTSSMGNDRSGQSNTSSTYGQNNPDTGSSSSSATRAAAPGRRTAQERHRLQRFDVRARAGPVPAARPNGQSGTGSSGLTYGPERHGLQRHRLQRLEPERLRERQARRALRVARLHGPQAPRPAAPPV